MRNILLATILIMVPAGVALAQTPTPATNKWRVDDVILSEDAGQFEVSRDGRWAVWVKSHADAEKDGRFRNLVLSSLTESREIQLTRGSESQNYSPRWSPNGLHIAFISTRPVPKAKPAAASEGAGPRPQIWLFSPFGGEPWNVTSLDRGVMSYEWRDDETIVFAAQEDPTQYEQAIKDKKDGSIVVEDEPHTPPVRLFSLAIKTGKVTRLTTNTDWIQSFALARDGRVALAIHQRSLRFTYDHKIKPVYFLHDLQTSESRQIFADRPINLEAVKAARDGDGFYLNIGITSHPQYINATVARLGYFDPKTNVLTDVPLDWENGLVAGVEPLKDGFAALLANGARHRAARYVRSGNGWRRHWLTGSQASNIFDLRAGDDGRTVLYRYSTGSTPSQWFRARLDGEKLVDAAQLTDLNPHLKPRVKARSEVVRWKGALDEEVEGILFYPHDYEPGKRYALMLMIHGGPYGADLDDFDESWAYPTNLVCERGAFVLKPNYHGSSNYGLKFGESITEGKYYDLEVPDIEKGVDALIARGLVNPERLGTMGWSNGSILSIALTINSQRYKVCGAGAGDVEWISDWGNAHFGASFDNHYFGKSPLEDPQLYIRKSPLFQMHKVRTPTIIFFGSADTNVPTSQGWTHYRAMQQLGLADVRFVLFPGEPHSLQKLSHQRRKLEEELAWFDKYLFNKPNTDNEALKKDSPLALTLKSLSFERVGEHFGRTVGGVLIPETVRHQAIEIGRFEITRAQFAAFDSNYRYQPGTDNYPANGVTFEQARAYCEWLSRRTGETYRLPVRSEVEGLYESAAAAGENTLDFWAGYAVNPEDGERLRRQVSQAGRGTVLLKPVGSFKGAGEEEAIFDLGGNVAEWAISEGGEGIILGGSADQPGDAKAARRRPDAPYIGFRIVKGRPAGSSATSK